MTDQPPIDELFPGLEGKLPLGKNRKCPVCAEPVLETSEAFPFCSKRCRTIDLGKWASGDYKISRPIEQRDLDED